MTPPGLRAGWPVAGRALLIATTLLTSAAKAQTAPTLTGFGGLSLVEYVEAHTVPATRIWQVRARLESGTPLVGTSSKRPQLNVTCDAGKLELGWYESSALTSRLGEGYLMRSGPLFRKVYMSYAPTSGGEYRALAYCVLGGSYSAPVNLMGPNGKVTIEDDNDPPPPPPAPPPSGPTVSLSVSRNPVPEGSSTTVTATLSNAWGSDVRIPLRLTAVTAEPDDYRQPAAIAIPGGRTDGKTRLVTRRDEDEDDETFIVALGALPFPVRAGTPDAATVTITDDGGERTLRVGDARVSEADGPLAFPITLSAARSAPVTVEWATSAGSATPGPDGDYADASGTLTFMPGETARTLDVTVRDDEIDEPDETLTVILSSPTNATLEDGRGEATGTIVDDDGPPRLRIADTQAQEDEGRLTFEVALTNPSAHPATVEWATSAGTATPGPGRDYTEASGTLSFKPGQTAGAVEVAVRDDRVHEGDETVFVTLSAPVNATLEREEDTATGTIIDNDRPPRIRILDAAAREDGGEMAFEIRLEGRSAHAVSVEWTSSAGTATPGKDYVEASGRLSFPPAATNGKIHVPLIDDATHEPDETFTLTLSRPTNGRIDGRAVSATGTILDDDDAPVPAMTIDDAAGVESGGAILFTASLDRPGARPATARWRTEASAATPGKDYVEASGTVTIEAGETSAAVPVDVIDDLLHEDTETFRVVLFDPVNATLDAPEAIGAIRDDDGLELAEAWLARFARTAAGHALEAVEDRIRRGTARSSHVTLAGRRLDLSPREAPTERLEPAGLAGSGSELPGGRARGETPGTPAADLAWILARSSFQFSGGARDGDRAGAEQVRGYGWSIWGRGAATSFGGGASGVSVDGDAAAGTVGLDFQRGRVLFGIAASHSFGEGVVVWHGLAGGNPRTQEMESPLTTGLPYLRVALNERTSLWGTLGHGKGSMTLSQAGLGSVETDIEMDMGALGLRRDVRRSAAECRCFDLALKADAMLLNASADESVALPALSRHVSRVRLMMEGSRIATFDSGATLRPSAELGLRYDDGDAETGGGVELGAGLSFAHPPRGVSMQVEGRSLLTHESGELAEWGLSGALRVDPGRSNRGLSFALRSSWGNANGGAGRLWERRQDASALGYRQARTRTAAEVDVGYGLTPFGDRARLMPYVGARLFDRSRRAWRLGASLRLSASFDLDLEGARTETPEPMHADLVLQLRGAWRW